MTLPSDDHKGWDRLFAAVIEDEPRDTEADADAAAAAVEDAPERVLDLQQLQERAGVTSGDTAGETRRI